MVARRLTITAIACAVAILELDAAAANNDQKTAATALFDEGLVLMDQGKYSEACPKFAQSQELAPSGGTLLNLARCYEKNGQRASAWISYKEAAVRAKAAKKRDMEKLASDAAKKLEPTLARLTIVVSQPIEGLDVRRNDRPVAAAELGVATPIDPGSYRIEASAPGRKKWTANLDVPDRADNQSIEIPKLEPLATATPTQTPIGQPSAASREQPLLPPDQAPSRGSGQRTLAIGVGIAGIVGIGVGTYFGLRAKSKNDDASAHCTSDTRCDAAGLELDDQARTSATVSTIAFGAGGALLAIGAALYFTAPNRSSTSANLRVESSRQASSLRLMIGKSF